MNLKKILIASHNAGKIKEFQHALQQLDGTQILLADKNLEEPEETGVTFAKNALLKAKYYAAHHGVTSLADDSGLEIPALGGEPGVRSGRWFRGFETAKDAFQALQQKMKGREMQAQFVCYLCLFDPATREKHIAQGVLKGVLVFPARGSEGFGYDPIFIPEGYTQTLSELGREIKSRISHRHQALQQLLLSIKAS